MGRQSDILRRQKEFILKSKHEFRRTDRSMIYDARHIFPQVEEIVDLLVNFKEYTEQNAFCDTGALFYGPKGTGKTMFARYVATKSGARFINARKFSVELKSGVHVWQENDVDNLFGLGEQWVKANGKPLVFFFDQFDDFLKIRPNIVSQFETRLEGFEGKPRGIFIIATSHQGPKEFGGSLFRNGRIGTHVAFSMPDRRQQSELLRGFLGRYEHEENIDTRNLVYILNEEASPVSVEAVVGEACRLATKEIRGKNKKGNNSRKPVIAEKHLLKVLISKALDSPTGHTLSKEEEFQAKVHEIGHYAVGRAWGLPHRFISIRPGLESLGFTYSTDDSKIVTFDELTYSMAAAFGGAEAERIFDIPENSGWGSDLKKINEIAEALVGLGYRNFLYEDYGLVDVNRDAKETSQEAMSALEKKELKHLIYMARMCAKETLDFFGRELIQKMADALSSKPDGVILQQELDTVLGEKLVEFHKKNKVVDLIN